MRNAAFDSIADVLIIVIIGVFILGGTGFALCKVMGWDLKALIKYFSIIAVIVLSFLLVAQILTLFF